MPSQPSNATQTSTMAPRRAIIPVVDGLLMAGTITRTRGSARRHAKRTLVAAAADGRLGYHPYGCTAHPMTPTPGDNILSFLSYNMQVGVGTKRYHEYITRGWRHVLPSRQVHENLGRIAELVAQHDFVGLQELDAGSRRSGHLNQLEWLAQHAGFHYWRAQVNRDLGQLAQHGLGLLARFTPFAVSEHKLPGRIPGRGALIARFGQPQQALAVVVTHLALTPGSRSQQLAAICDLLAA